MYFIIQILLFSFVWFNSALLLNINNFWTLYRMFSILNFSLCMHFFLYLLLCTNLFSIIFACINFFFVFFPTPTPHHFSNGGSLKEVCLLVFINSTRFIFKKLMIRPTHKLTIVIAYQNLISLIILRQQTPLHISFLFQ